MDVFTAERVLEFDRCQWVRAAMTAGAGATAEVLDDHHDDRRATDVDVSDEVIDFVESCLDARRDEIAAFFETALCGREGAGFLRYESGGCYGPHVDRADMPSWPDAARRAITIVLFLNSSRDANASGDFSGGCLRLFPNGMAHAHVDIVPAAGTLVAFPSSTPHEVTLVTDGCRDAVVDWYYS
jgi:predicted 2-oxoglutarate/Fe(II)-dependent dioxygenase YbiX